MALQNDFSKFGLQLVNINGTYFVVEKGGFGQSGGVSGVDASTAQQLMSQGVQPVVIPQQDAEVTILANKYGLNFSTAKDSNLSLGALQNRISSGYVAGEQNQLAQEKQVTDAATANAQLAANPQAPTVDPNASNPNMERLPNGTYVPKGSAGALNSTNQGAYNAQYGQGTFDAQGNPIAAPVGAQQNFAVSAQTMPNTQQTGSQYQILNVASIGQYKPTDYHRDANGAVVLNPGVVPIPGTVKDLFATGAPSGSTSNASQNTLAGITRDMAREQAFVNSFNNANKRLPSTSEVNQGVYGTTSPQFNTPQGVDAIKAATSTSGSANTGTSSTTGGTTGKNDALSQANSIIDGSNLPPDLKTLYKQVVSEYPDKAFNTQSILNTFNKIKTETIDPRYYELANTAQKDFSTSLSQLNQTRENQLETERANAGKDIRQARANLEKSGMMFTGQGIEQLGAQSAYPQASTTPGTTPAQTPFGGLFYEGTVNQGNRLMATSNAANYNKTLQALGRSAEDKLGTTGASALGINYSPAGGVTSSLDTAKQQQYATTLSQLYNNSQAKTKLNTDVPNL